MARESVPLVTADQNPVRVVLLFLAALLVVSVPLAGCKKNRPPGQAAVPWGPASARTGQVLAFSSSATDDDNDSVAVRFDWGDGDTSDWSIIDFDDGDTAVADSHSWWVADTYTIRAQARDAKGALSEWSGPHPVTIVNDGPPSTPSPRDIPDSLVACDTLHIYSRLYDPDKDRVSIRVSWGDGDTSAWSDLVPSGENGWAAHAWKDSGTYSVRAQARDEYGATSDWSEECTVHVWLAKWVHLTGWLIRSSPAVAADGTVYIGSDDKYLYAFGPSGMLKWRYLTEGPVRSSPAVAADGTVYIGSDDGHLYALDPRGTLRWRYKVGGVVCNTPAIAADGTVYACAGDSCMHAVNPDGSLKWRCRYGNQTGGGFTYSSPAVAADGTIYIGCTDRHLSAINPNGTVKWSYQTGLGVFASPAVGSDGTIHFGSGDGLQYAVNPEGTLKWRYGPESGPNGNPTIAADGTVYVAGDAELYALNPDGTLRWCYRTGKGMLGGRTAVADDGTVYFVGGGFVYAINANGTSKWRRQIGNPDRFSSPAIAADGTLYFGSERGYVYAIGADSPLADSPWPKFHHDNTNTGRVDGRR